MRELLRAWSSGASGAAGLWAGVVVGVLVVAGGASAWLLSTSAATFTAATSNDGNRIATASIELFDDAEGVLFEVDLLAPGDTTTHCVEVTYRGQVQDPSAVRLWSAGQRDPGGLGDHVLLEVVQGAPAATCADFVAEESLLAVDLTAFARTHVDHPSGVGTWVPVAAEETRAYRLALTLALDAPNEVAGQRVDELGIVWEVTS